VKAVVMAGGEGSRLRPLTANLPKPLLPVANRPVMEHVLRLLRRHGVTDTIVTVQFLASLVRNYFGDGDELGMSLQYATEERPLGTAGSVKNAEAAVRDDTFLVISGDALTDVDLSAMVAYHRERGALVTVGLKAVADPLEYGIVICDGEGRVNRFLEKPTWGQVFSDTVNTGIYVMDPAVLDAVASDTEVDWSGDVFPRLLAAGEPVFGYAFDGYWEDVGTLESYRQAHLDVLNREVDVEIDAFEVSPGVWIAEGAEVDPDVEISGPVLIGDYTRVEAGAALRPFTVLGDNVVIKAGAVLERAVVHDNVFIGPRSELRGCVVGRNSDVMRATRVEEGAVIGDDCVVEQEAFLSAGVKVYPFKTVEAGAVVTTSVIWESRGHRSLFGPRGVSGLVNVEITPDLAVRLASAWATTMHKGSVVIASRDVSRAATALKRAVVSALTASAIDVRDLEVSPAPVARFATAHSDAVGGIMIHTSPGDAQSVDIVFLDEQGADLSQTAQRKLERVFSRQEFRRAFPGEIAQLSYPARTLDTYTQEVLAAVDTSGVVEADLRVVIDTAGGAAAVVLPTLLGRLGVDALIVNGRLDESTPTETLSQHMAGLERLGEMVASSRASFGARFDPIAERLARVAERGPLIHHDRAVIVVMDLVAAERRRGRVALPVTSTRVAEQVAAFHGVHIAWTGTSPQLLSAAAAEPDVVFAADGRGGFVIPEFSTAVDGIAAFTRLLGLVARTKLTMSEIDVRIPQAAVVRRSIPTAWAAKGTAMRAVLEAADGRTVDTTDGVRVVEADGRWALVLPDPTEAVTHVWAEAATASAASALLDEWVAVVEAAQH
jgi:mannose-1-phosphate guanylyltransferase/phosphomannomutase